MVCVIYGTTFDMLLTLYETGVVGRPVFGASVGVGLGVCLALLEHSSFAERMGRLPFTVALLAKTTDRPPIVVPPTVLVQRPPEAWGEGR